MKIKKRKKIKKKFGKLTQGRPFDKDIAKKMTIRARRRFALECREEGKSYYEIGQMCGTDQALAYQDVNYMLKELEEKTAEKVDRLRRLELTRLDRLLERIVPALKSPDYYERLSAVEKALKIMDRRARYIPGMDTPAVLDAGEGMKEAIEQTSNEVILILQRLAGVEE